MLFLGIYTYYLLEYIHAFLEHEYAICWKIEQLII